jgi:hypothetical protein
MIDKKIIGWFSCGITSAVACKLAVDKYGKDNVILIYFVIDSAHEDNERFIKQCEDWIGVKIERRRSSKYKDQFDVIEKTRYINGPSGARCTKELKKDVRISVENEINYEHQVFGFEFDKKEVNRAIRFTQQNPHTNPIFPLIEERLTKEICAGILINAGIELPTMYKLGFHNNNCKMCVKGGMGYANLIKKNFPDDFDRMAKLERKIGRSCIKNKFLDELKESDGRHEPPILPDCGTFCEIELADIEHKDTIKVVNGDVTIQNIIKKLDDK